MPTRLAADVRLGDALTTTGGTTLLSYALLTNPDPLQAGAADASLTLVVANDGSQFVDCMQIVVVVPVGSNAKDLTADAVLLSQVAAGWNATVIGGIVTLTPDTPPAQIGREGLAFVISGFGANDQPGTANLAVTETASVPSDPTPCARVGTIAVPKFPPQFTVGALTADPPDVPSGGTTMLIWTGTPPSATAPASYTLSYNPGTGPVSVPVGATGTYTSEPLTQTPTVVFTLEVSITVAGQDAALVVQRQTTVQVDVPAPVIQQFSGEILSRADWILLRLAWATQYAETVAISGFSTLFTPSGSWTVTPTAQAPLLMSYTLTASSEAGTANATLTLGWGAGGPTLPVGNAPSAVAVTPDGARAFIALEADDTVTVLDARSLQGVGSTLPVGKAPQAIAVTPDGARAFVANDGDNTVTVLDATTDPPTVVGKPIPVGNFPCSIAVTPDSKRVFVVNMNDNTVTVLDATTDPPTAIGKPIPVGNSPSAVAVTPDGTRAFVVSGSVTVLDATTDPPTVVGGPIPVGKDPFAIAVSPDGTRAFVTGLDDTLTVLDATTDPPTVVGGPIGVGGLACSIAVTPDGTRVLIANAGGNTVTVLDVTTDPPTAIGKPIPVGNVPMAVAVSPDGTRAFVANNQDKTVTVLVPTVTGGTGA